jgi:hypothetical protein
MDVAISRRGAGALGVIRRGIRAETPALAFLSSSVYLAAMLSSAVFS